MAAVDYVDILYCHTIDAERQFIFQGHVIGNSVHVVAGTVLLDTAHETLPYPLDELDVFSRESCYRISRATSVWDLYHSFSLV